MHCPKCGQQQISADIRYCSRCGFLLTGVAEVVANDGIVPGGSPSRKGVKTKRKQGLKQAAFVAIIGLVLVPILIAFLVATNGPPEFAISVIFLFKAFIILRVAYAFLFQSNDPIDEAGNQIPQPAFSNVNEPAALPNAASIPANAYAAPGTGAWRDTNDLATPHSVTDTTTKLLEKNR